MSPNRRLSDLVPKVSVPEGLLMGPTLLWDCKEKLGLFKQENSSRAVFLGPLLGLVFF